MFNLRPWETNLCSIEGQRRSRLLGQPTLLLHNQRGQR